jgi:hypothetical protein
MRCYEAEYSSCKRMMAGGLAPPIETAAFKNK